LACQVSQQLGGWTVEGPNGLCHFRIEGHSGCEKFRQDYEPSTPRESRPDEPFGFRQVGGYIRQLSCHLNGGNTDSRRRRGSGAWRDRAATHG
jgi:hypothetical protein